MSKELADRFNTYVAEWVSSVARPDAEIAPTTEWPKLLAEVEHQSAAIADANANAERESWEAKRLHAQLAIVRNVTIDEVVAFLRQIGRLLAAEEVQQHFNRTQGDHARPDTG